MGAFNILRATAACPACRNAGEFEIQFKYGNTWQIEYRIGDALKWGGNQVGHPGAKRVRVEGLPEACPSCGVDGLSFEITVEDNRIAAVRPLDTDGFGPEGYEVLE